jgi:hypothetical protein
MVIVCRVVVAVSEHFAEHRASVRELRECIERHRRAAATRDCDCDGDRDMTRSGVRAQVASLGPVPVKVCDGRRDAAS